jgi:hypothetical protein
MNNKDAIDQQKIIISNAQSYIKELERQQGKRFEPATDTKYYLVKGDGVVTNTYNDNLRSDRYYYDNFNFYETEELAIKAAVMMKRSNAIIMARLMADPDFVPDYFSGNQAHYSFGYTPGDIGYISGWGNRVSYTHNCGPSVSTLDKWEEAAALLKEWGVE